MMRPLSLALLAAAAVAMQGCSECFGTPSCDAIGAPEVSYTGQFVERKTGQPVAGVNVSFIRTEGAELAAVPRAVSSSDGFFVLRAPALQGGVVTGELRVEPPGRPPYTVAVSMLTNTVRGDGGSFGRFVVDPYLLLVGIVRDRETGEAIPGARVIFQRLSGGRLESDTRTFITDHGGQFGWEPEVLEVDTVHAEFTIQTPDGPRDYVVRRDLLIRHVDGEMSFIILPAGWGLAYSGAALRRGSERPLPGVSMHYRRLAGIGTNPEETPLAINQFGGFNVDVEPLQEGTLTAELRIVPPAPIPPATYVVNLQTSDDDIPAFLGWLRYGSQVHVQAQLRFADTGEPVPSTAGVTFERKGGVALDWPQDAPDDGRRPVGADGRITFRAPTTDSGSTQFDIIVRLPEPLAWDTLRNVSVPSRYSDDSTSLGALLVRRRSR